MYSNYLSTPTDCPQRDERLGWTADTDVFAKTAMYRADVKDFLAKYLADLRDGRVRRLDELNSPEAESYHTFSSDGRWMVFSSRRDDGVHTRPYFAFFDAERGVFAKPFLLPAEDPAEHARQFRSYNIPEFLKGPIRESPAELKAVGRGAR